LSAQIEAAPSPELTARSGGQPERGVSTLRYGSLFSGIGGFDLGADRAGWECAWQVEIDPKCVDVLEQHWPGVERFGDVREVGAHNLAPVDLICGGFPCQDLSVAGRREGLAGVRSGLWWEFHRIVAELRPAWVVVENVPGLLSSNRGRDMGTILGALADLGYGWSYRVLDAEWFGLAQRRKRVFIVGHLGDYRAAEVLLEPEGGGDSPPGQEARETPSPFIAHGAGTARTGARWEETSFCVTQALTGAFGSGGADDTKAQAGFLVPVGAALTARYGKGTDSDATDVLVIQDVRSSTRDKTNAGQGIGIRYGDPMYTLDATSQHAVAYALRADPGGTGQGHNTSYVITHALTAEGHDASEDGTGRGTPIIAVGRGSVPVVSSEVALPVTTRRGDPGHIFRTLRGFSHGWQGQHNDDIAMSGMVRRITPLECERLQGFPDGWTAWGPTAKKGRKKISDSTRYRMLGNAVAVPVAEWIFRRIRVAEAVRRGRV